MRKVFLAILLSLDLICAVQAQDTTDPKYFNAKVCYIGDGFEAVNLVKIQLCVDTFNRAVSAQVIDNGELMPEMRFSIHTIDIEDDTMHLGLSDNATLTISELMIGTEFRLEMPLIDSDFIRKVITFYKL